MRTPKISPFAGPQVVSEGQPLAAVPTSPLPTGAPRRRTNAVRHPVSGKFTKGSKGRFGV